jgi:F-type H+-transporting ATPase subunit epsilon
MQVELVSPERILLSVEAIMVRARTLSGGDIAFLTGHAAFIGALATWRVDITPVDGAPLLAAVHGGFISINHDHVKILSDLAELADQVDVARAQAAADRAEAELGADAEDVAAGAALARAHARLRTAGVLV